MVQYPSLLTTIHRIVRLNNPADNHLDQTLEEITEKIPPQEINLKKEVMAKLTLMQYTGTTLGRHKTLKIITSMEIMDTSTQDIKNKHLIIPKELQDQTQKVQKYQLSLNNTTEKVHGKKQYVNTGNKGIVKMAPIVNGNIMTSHR